MHLNSESQGSASQPALLKVCRTCALGGEACGTCLKCLFVLAFRASVEQFFRRGPKELLTHVVEGLLVSPLEIALSRLIFEMGDSGLEIFEHCKRRCRVEMQFHVVSE
jgi:hypothetical protein